MKLSRDELIDRIASASRENRKLLVHNSTDPKADAKHSRMFSNAIAWHFESLAPAAIGRNELIELIAYAVQRNRKLLIHASAAAEASAASSRTFATAILRHLEQNGMLVGKSGA